VIWEFVFCQRPTFFIDVMVSDKYEASHSGSDDRADGFATITFRKVFGYRKALVV
jgi:hypothetical protein